MSWANERGSSIWRILGVIGFVLICTLTAVFGGQAFAAVSKLIDHFDTGSQALSITGQIASATTVEDARAATNAAGGHRYISLTVVSQQAGTATADVFIGNPGVYAFALPPTGTGGGATGRGMVAWTGADDSTSQLLDLGLCATGTYPSDRFTFIFNSIDQAARMSLEVAKGADVRTVNFDVPAVFTGPIYLPFSQFGADWQTFFCNVGRIRLTFPVTLVPGLDFALDTLQAECSLPSPKLATFTANPSIVSPGAKTNLCWTYDASTGAVLSQAIDQGVGSVPVGTMCKEVTVPSVPITYKLTVQGECGSDFKTVTIGPSSKVPSLTEWGIIILSLILAGSAVVLLRRRQSVS